MKKKLFLLIIASVLFSGCSKEKNQTTEEDTASTINEKQNKYEYVTEEDVSKIVSEEIGDLKTEIYDYIDKQITSISIEMTEEEKEELRKNILTSVDSMIQQKIGNLNQTTTNNYNEYITKNNETTNIVDAQPINKIKDISVGGQFPMTFFKGTKDEFTIRSISATIEPINKDDRNNPYELFRVKHNISTNGSDEKKYEIIFQNSGLNYSLETSGNFEGILTQDIRMDASVIYVVNVKVVD